jgi:hypothetical protein
MSSISTHFNLNLLSCQFIISLSQKSPMILILYLHLMAYADIGIYQTRWLKFIYLIDLKIYRSLIAELEHKL